MFAGPDIGLAPGNDKRVARPLGELVGVVIKPFRQFSKRGDRPPPRLGAVFERPAALRLEARDGVGVGFQIDFAARHQAEHDAVGEQAGAAEQAAHFDRTETGE